MPENQTTTRPRLAVPPGVLVVPLPLRDQLRCVVVDLQDGHLVQRADMDVEEAASG